MKITVLGCGRWGSFLAWYHGQNHSICLWGRETSKAFQQLQTTGKNQYVTLPASVALSSDLEAALAFAPVVVISIGAQHLRELAARIEQYPVAGKTFVLCMKGLESETGKRLTQVFEEEIHQPVKVAVWVGPGHVQDFTRRIPNCMVVDSKDPETVGFLVEKLNSDLIRLYRGNDLIGTEVGAAAKNVIGIAAGMLDGKGLSSLKGALMARGAREIARLIRAMGGNELSAYGLCHLGDYEATLFSPHSHNRQYGENYILGKAYGELAEGVSTVEALVRLGQELDVDLPICRTVYNILYSQADADQALKALFARSVKGEFDA